MMLHWASCTPAIRALHVHSLHPVDSGVLLRQLRYARCGYDTGITSITRTPVPVTLLFTKLPQ